MAWIALADHTEETFVRGGLGGDSGRAPGTARMAPECALPRGSFVLEARITGDRSPEELLSWQAGGRAAARLSIQSLPDGGVVFVMALGSDLRHATASLTGLGMGDTLRITYSWDLPSQWARLVLERVGSEQLSMVALEAPLPLRLSHLHAILCDRPRRKMHPDVAYIALSTAIEPVGPMPGMTARTPIITSYGLRKAAEISRGDLVRSDRDGLVSVLHTIRRLVPARGAFRPVRLRAPYFGLAEDIVVAPDQRLVIGGSDVEYMFGRERVLVPARHLVNGVAAMHCTGGLTVCYHGLILPHNEPVKTLGAALESVFIGRIRRKRVRLASSLLAEIDSHSLPEHAQSAYPVLRPFESLTLLDKRAA